VHEGLFSPSEALRDLNQVLTFIERNSGRLRLTADGIMRHMRQGVALLGEHPIAGRVRNEVRPSLPSTAASTQVAFDRVLRSFAYLKTTLSRRKSLRTGLSL
jgi:plasmid stabilization system protein ParE